MRQGKARDSEQQWRLAPRNYAPRPVFLRRRSSNWPAYACAVAIGVAIACILAQWGIQ